MEYEEISTVDDYKPEFEVGQTLRDGSKVIAVNAMVTYEYKVEEVDGGTDWYNQGQLEDMEYEEDV